jgi:osmotically-inducible protein OsmY
MLVAAAALIVAGCDRPQEAADNRSTEQTKDTIQETAREAKSDIEKEAEAKKEMVEAEAKAAQAKLEAEKARAQAAAAEAQSKADAAAATIRDAGAAGARSQSEVGTSPQPTTPTTPPTPADPGTPPPTTTTSDVDQKLVEQVRAAVTPAGADSSSVQTVQVSAAGGIVTLKGNVKTEEEKTRMETAAKAVPGVTKVENQIEVKAE